MAVPLVRSQSQPSLSSSSSSLATIHLQPAPSPSSTPLSHPHSHSRPLPPPPPPPHEQTPPPSRPPTRPRSSSRSTKAAQFPPSHRNRSGTHGSATAAAGGRGPIWFQPPSSNHPYAFQHYSDHPDDDYTPSHTRNSSSASSSFLVPLNGQQKSKRTRLRTAVTVLLVFVGLVLLGTILVLSMVQTYFGVWEVDVIRREEVDSQLMRLQGSQGEGEMGAYGGHFDGVRTAVSVRQSLEPEIATADNGGVEEIASVVKRALGNRQYKRQEPTPFSTAERQTSPSDSTAGDIDLPVEQVDDSPLTSTPVPSDPVNALPIVDTPASTLPITAPPPPSTAGDIGLESEEDVASRWEKIVQASVKQDGTPVWPVTPALREGERIPRFIHQTWKTKALPERWERVRRECEEMMPDYDYFLWTDELSHQFISTFYPWFLPTFESYPYNIQRADAIRYFVLYHYGGVYLDLDVGCRRRLDPLLAFPAILPRTIPVGVSNDLMFSEQKSKFMDYVIHNLVTFDLNLFTNYPTVMFSTGPMFISLQYNLWPLRAPSSSAVRILPKMYYGKNAKPSESTHSFFFHYYGSSWHDGDAGFIVWLGRSGKIILWVALITIIVGAVRLGWGKVAGLWKRGAREGARYVQLSTGPPAGGSGSRRGSIPYSDAGMPSTPALPLSRPSSPGPRLAGRSRTPIPQTPYHNSTSNSGFWFFLPASLYQSSSNSSPNTNSNSTPTSPRGWASFLPPFPSYVIPPQSSSSSSRGYQRVSTRESEDVESDPESENGGYRLHSIRSEAPPVPEKNGFGGPLPPPKYERYATNGTTTLLHPQPKGYHQNGGLSVVSSASTSPAVGMSLSLTRTPSPRSAGHSRTSSAGHHRREATDGTDDSSTYDDAEMGDEEVGWEEELGREMGEEEDRDRDGDVDLEGFGTTGAVGRRGRVEDEVDRLLEEMRPDVERK